jgi:hypothetical protein
VSGATEKRLKTQDVVKNVIFWLFFEQKKSPPKFMKKKLHPRLQPKPCNSSLRSKNVPPRPIRQPFHRSKAMKTSL